MLIVRPRFLLVFLAALFQLMRGAPATAQDGDADGIIDEQDNCLIVGNPTQLDTNLDGYGNRCDTDYNNDGVCAAADFSAFKQAYFSTVGSPNYDADIDVEGNGVINASDFSVFKQYYALPVDPSGLGCAGSVPCTCDAPVLESVEEVLPWDVELSWTAAAGSRFEIERRAAGGAWATIASPSASESSYVDSSLTPGSYEYRMRADCSAGSGSPQWSEYSTVAALELSVECDSQAGLGAGLPIPPALPCTGLPEYQAVSALPVPGGMVNVAGGNLLVVGDEIPVDTRLGPFRLSRTYSAAWGAWIWSFDLSYHGSMFVDDTLTIHDVASLANGAAIPGTHWVKVDADTMQTKGGLVHEFGADGLLAATHWSSSDYPRMVYTRAPVQFEPTWTRLTVTQARFEGDTNEWSFSEFYDAQHRVVTESDPTHWVLEYDPSGRLVTVKDYHDDQSGKPGIRYEYNGTLLTAITNAEGERTEYSYDASRRITEIRQIGGPNPVHSFSYSGPDPATGLYQTTYTDPLGHPTRFRYDHRRRLREVESVDTGELAVREWQGKRITKLVQPDGVTTAWTISNDDVVSETSASGNVTTITHQASGVNRNNPRQRAILRVEDSIGLVEQAQYDAQGRLVSVANGESETTIFSYDADQMIASVTDPAGVTTSYSQYGPHGKPTIVQNGGETSAVFVYDASGLLIQATSLYGQGGVKTRDYDSDGNLETIETSERTNPYSGFGGGQVTTTYRSDHRPLSVWRYPGYGDHSFVYDSLGRLIERREKVDGTWQSTHFEYDAASRMLAIDLPNGMRQEVTRDPYGRPLTRRSLRGGVEEAHATFTYDQGRITSSYDSIRGGTEQYSYDFAGRIVSILYPNGERLDQGYDLRSRRTFETYSLPGSGTLRSIGFVWDLADRQIATFDQGMQILHRTFSGGHLATADYGNGLHRTFTYDPQTGLQTAAITTKPATGATLEVSAIERALLFDGGIGRYQVTATTTTSGGVDQTSIEQYWLGPFTDNEQDFDTPFIGKRVFRWSDGTNIRGYEYDALGNRQNQGDDSFTYNAERNRLSSAYLDDLGQTIAYSYDAAGFATSRGGVPIGWTATGRMSSFGSESMQWDMSERLVSSYLGGTLRDFSRFGGRIERNPTNGAFVSLDLGAVSIDLVSGARTYRHLDFRGNVKFTSNDAGLVTSHIRYSPYRVDEVFGTSSDATQFAGGQSFGPLVQLGARVYDSDVGRFLSPDPVFQLLNQYSYTSGNPALFWDDAGLHEVANSARAEAVGKLNAAAAVNAGIGGVLGASAFAAAQTGRLRAATVLGAGAASAWVASGIFWTYAGLLDIGVPLPGVGIFLWMLDAGGGDDGGRNRGPGCLPNCGDATSALDVSHLHGISAATGMTRMTGMARFSGDGGGGGGGAPVCAPSSLTRMPNPWSWIWLLIILQVVLAAALMARRRRSEARR